MLLGVIADDFTGASDIANTIAKGVAPEGGLRTIQYLGVPSGPAPAHVEACVISLKIRSIPAAEAVAQALRALDWLVNENCRQVVLKYCSTFDSTPAGNIGPVGEELARRLDAAGVVACCAFPDNGRTIYMGHLFIGDRLLNESGMEHHPLNPMTDADLRRWLGHQAREPVGLVDWHVLQRGPAAVAKALRAGAARGERLAIVDALTNDHLLIIAEACAEARLLTGGSGVALGLPRNFIKAGLAKGGRPEVPPVLGPEVVLAGSCSRATLNQIDVHSRSHPALAIDVDRLMADQLSLDEFVRFVRGASGQAPLIYSSSPPARLAAIQQQYGGERTAKRLEQTFAELARLLFDDGVRRIVVGGGETAGAVVSALGVASFHVGSEIDPGVPVLVSENGPRIGMALKSGNFGAPDFFEKALGAIAGDAES